MPREILGSNLPLYPSNRPYQCFSELAPKQTINDLFAAAVKAGVLIEGDSTVLEYCEGDVRKAAEFLGITLDK